MNKSADLLNELIEIARDGERFYLDAASKVRSGLVRDIFRELAAVRCDLRVDLSSHVSARGDRPSDASTLLGAARKGYAAVLANLSDDRDTVDVGQLEEVEDRLLNLFRDALKDPPSAALRTILERHLVTVLVAHNKLRTLKEISQAA
jgi:uncharacterized protein (TIGR02284 family)